jgi:hypothetical protein
MLAASGVDDRVMRAYLEAAKRYADRPWVTGISISRKETAHRLTRSFDPVIAIHVRRKRRMSAQSRNRIPKAILGVATDVVQGDYRRGQGGAGTLAFQLAPGASISCIRGTAGTLGAIVSQGTERCLLTAAHVLQECGQCRKGAAVVHPGLADSGAATAVPVARLLAAHLGLDAGIASLSPAVAAQNVALLSGVRLMPPVVPVINDVLEKSGRTTGITRARVQGIGTFHGVFPAIHLRPLLGGMGTLISDRGDSGAVWYSVASGAAVGLHVAGDVSGGNRFAVAAVLTEVVRGLRLAWM